MFPAKQFDDFATSFLVVDAPPIEKQNWRNDAKIKQPHLFEFDPNKATKEDFIALGLSPKIANTILNFRKKNGRFYEPADLKKIYGFRSEDYLRLKEYIKIMPSKKSKNINQKEDAPIKSLFQFDPNLATVEDFTKLGLSVKIAKRIEKYRNKGGRFYKKEDFKKIYGLSEKMYAELENYLLLPQKTYPTHREKESIKEKSSEPIQVDINQSSTEDWQMLRGIGPSYAKKILNFRSKLGGFSSIPQVGETYHLPDSVFQQIKPFLRASPIFRPIDINSISEDELKVHPYFSWKQAKNLVNYRKHHHRFKNMEDVKKIKGVFSETDWERIAPYLVF